MSACVGIIRLLSVGFLLAFVVDGCAGSSPTNLYTLSAVSAPAAETGRNRRPSSLLSAR